MDTRNSVLTSFNGSRTSMGFKFELLPLRLLDKVALDTKTKTVFTDLRTSGNPHFMTWLNKTKRNDGSITVELREIAQIAQLHEQGFVQKAIGGDKSGLLVRNYALDLIAQASKYGASDIHIMMRGTHADVQFEIGGDLYHFLTVFHNEGGAIARAIFQGIAQTKAATYEELAYQNAQISGSEFPPECKLSSCRIFRGPAFSLGAQGGGFMTIRLQYLAGHKKEDGLDPLFYPERPAGHFALAEMGYSAAQIAKIDILMNTPAGVVLFIGPTGSGKTTTLFQILQHLARIKPYNRQVTVEDPVENPMAWAGQMVITNAKNDEEVGIEYANLTRGALRMAPKILFLGEIRGPAVASSVIEAALTGHQVWSTMHATDPFLAIDRIETMDPVLLPRKRFCDPAILCGVITQRLIPIACQHCKVQISQSASDAPSLSPRFLESLASWGDLSQVYVEKEGGCQHCNYTGKSKRVAIAEVILFDEDLMDDFVNHGSRVARKNYRARADADLPLLDQALNLVFAGAVDPRALEKTVGLIRRKPVSAIPSSGLEA